jgi:hypothetical protein
LSKIHHDEIPTSAFFSKMAAMRSISSQLAKEPPRYSLVERQTRRKLRQDAAHRSYVLKRWGR